MKENECEIIRIGEMPFIKVENLEKKIVEFKLKVLKESDFKVLRAIDKKENTIDNSYDLLKERIEAYTGVKIKEDEFPLIALQTLSIKLDELATRPFLELTETPPK
jgi:hypothetical protein